MLRVEGQGREACLLYIVDLDAVVFACLHGQLLLAALDALPHVPQVYEGVGIDDEAQLVVAADGEEDGLVAGWNEGAVKAGGEVLEADARGEDRVAAVAQLQRLFEVDHRDGRTFHLGVVPVGGLDARIAQRVFDLAETALEGLVACQATALYVADASGRVDHPGFLRDAFEGGDGACGIACVVAPHHDGVVCVGAHDDEARISGEWQDAVVLQQHDALEGHLCGQGLVLV